MVKKLTLIRKNKKLEKWAEKYPRSVSGIVEMTQRMIKFLDKLK